MMILSTVETADSIETLPPSPRRKMLVRLGWIFFTLFCLIFFTLIKLPDEKIKAYIDGQISQVLAQKNITFTSNESKLSFLFGISYKMKGVTLNFPPPAPPARIDEVKVSPSLLPLALGKMGGAFSIYQGDGTLKGSASFKDTKGSISFDSHKLDLGKVGLLPIAAGIQGSGILNGDGSISGDLGVPSTLEGDANLKLEKFVLEPQSIMGFPIPKVQVSETVAEIAFDKGKLNLKNVRFGKQGSQDDIQGKVSGEITLGKNWGSSVLNLKVQFSLSQTLLKSFILLDAILGSGKQADGSYAFSLTGPMYAPTPAPLGRGGP